MNRKITCQNDYIIYQIDEKDIPKAAEFVVRTNYKKHRFMVDNKQLESEITEIVRFEKRIFEHSCFYMATTIDGKIVGTIRVQMIKGSSIELPYDIDLDSINKVCHIGRFAIDQTGYDRLGYELFKRMVLIAFSHVCQNSNNILIAECDTKLYHVLVRMGIDIIKVGNPYLCLGSETISVYAPYKSVIEYYSKYDLLQQL